MTRALRLLALLFGALVLVLYGAGLALRVVLRFIVQVLGAAVAVVGLGLALAAMVAAARMLQ